MMKITVVNKQQSISFDVERNIPPREAFEALSAFTISAFDDVSLPLVFSLANGSDMITVQDPQDWKVALDLFESDEVVLTLNYEGQEMASESEDESYEMIESTTEGMVSISSDEEIVQEQDEPVIEDYNEKVEQSVEEEVNQPKNAAVEPPAPEQEPEKPMSCREKIASFVADVGAEILQNMIVILHSLLQDGIPLGDALRTAVETCEAAAAHPLVQQYLPLVDAFAPLCAPWIPMLVNFDVNHIVAMVPQLIEAITQAAEGKKDVNLDIRGCFPPEVIAELESRLGNGQERVFNCDAVNPFNVINEARQAITEEFGGVHNGISCDECEVSPIVGARFKCTVRPNYDLCQNCEPNSDAKYPLIKIKVPVEPGTSFQGLWEFVKQTGGHRGRGRCRGRRGRGRFGRCGGRRGRGRGFGGPCPPFMRDPAQSPNFPCDMNQLPPCVQSHPMFRAFFPNQEPSAPETEEKISAPQHEEKKEEATAPASNVLKDEIKALKQEAIRCRKEMKQVQQKKKQKVRELKAVRKSVKKQKKALQAEVVRHVDMDEFSVQEPNNSVLKTWKVKNVGKVAWSDDTVACFVKGNEDMVVPDFRVVHVGRVEPGDVAYIHVMLQVPAVIGKYTVVYKLNAPVDNQFVDYGYMKTIVAVKRDAEEKEIENEVEELYEEPEAPVVQPAVSQEIAPVEEPVELPVRPMIPQESIESAQEEVVEEIIEAEFEPEVEEEAFEYQDQLESLLSMGFDDVENCKAALVATGGRIENALNALWS